MTYGKAALAALERGPMTIDEIAFEAGIGAPSVKAYLKYHLIRNPPNVHEFGKEKSERTGQMVTIYARGPGQGQMEAG